MPSRGAAEGYLVAPVGEDVSERQGGHHVPRRPAAGDQYS